MTMGDASDPPTADDVLEEELHRLLGERTNKRRVPLFQQAAAAAADNSPASSMASFNVRNVATPNVGVLVQPTPPSQAGRNRTMFESVKSGIKIFARVISPRLVPDQEVDEVGLRVSPRANHEFRVPDGPLSLRKNVSMRRNLLDQLMMVPGRANAVTSTPCDAGTHVLNCEVSPISDEVRPMETEKSPISDEVRPMETEKSPQKEKDPEPELTTPHCSAIKAVPKNLVVQLTRIELPAGVNQVSVPPNSDQIMTSDEGTACSVGNGDLSPFFRKKSLLANSYIAARPSTAAPENTTFRKPAPKSKKVARKKLKVNEDVDAYFNVDRTLRRRTKNKSTSRRPLYSQVYDENDEEAAQSSQPVVSSQEASKQATNRSSDRTKSGKTPRKSKPRDLSSPDEDAVPQQVLRKSRERSRIIREPTPGPSRAAPSTDDDTAPRKLDKTPRTPRGQKKPPPTPAASSSSSTSDEENIHPRRRRYAPKKELQKLSPEQCNIETARFDNGVRRGTRQRYQAGATWSLRFKRVPLDPTNFGDKGFRVHKRQRSRSTSKRATHAHKNEPKKDLSIVLEQSGEQQAATDPEIASEPQREKTPPRTQTPAPGLSHSPPQAPPFAPVTSPQRTLRPKPTDQPEAQFVAPQGRAPANSGARKKRVVNDSEDSGNQTEDNSATTTATTHNGVISHHRSEHCLLETLLNEERLLNYVETQEESPCITSMENIIFRTADGLWYAQYGNDTNKSTGYVRFGPGIRKPEARAKKYKLNFLLLYGMSVRVTVNGTTWLAKTGDLIAVEKGSRYALENPNDHPIVVHFNRF